MKQHSPREHRSMNLFRSHGLRGVSPPSDTTASEPVKFATPVGSHRNYLFRQPSHRVIRATCALRPDIPAIRDAWLQSLEGNRRDRIACLQFHYILRNFNFLPGQLHNSISMDTVVISRSYFYTYGHNLPGSSLWIRDEGVSVRISFFTSVPAIGDVNKEYPIILLESNPLQECISTDPAGKRSHLWTDTVYDPSCRNGKKDGVEK